MVLEIGKKLAQNEKTISTAESCTGGLIGAEFTAVSGSSNWYKGGVIAYSNEIKEQVLSVPKEILLKEGAVSSKVVFEMANRVSNLFQTDYAISVSGIAGPTGGSIEKPVGLVFIGIKTPNDIFTYKCNFDGGRESVRAQSVNFALDKMLKTIR